MAGQTRTIGVIIPCCDDDHDVDGDDDYLQPRQIKVTPYLIQELFNQQKVGNPKVLCYKTKNPVGKFSESLFTDGTKTSVGQEYDDVICAIPCLVIYRVSWNCKSTFATIFVC